MISDVMHETVANLDHYLNDPVYAKTYTGELRQRILRLRNEAEGIRVLLDTPPGSPNLTADNVVEFPPTT